MVSFGARFGLFLSLVLPNFGCPQLFERLLVFGDSMMDSGLDAVTCPHGFIRASDGPMMADYLARKLRIAPDQVFNWAYYGGKSGLDNYYNISWSGINWQIDEYLKENNNQVPPNTLIVYEMAGINDLLLDEQGSNKTLDTLVKNNLAALKKLVNAGADRFHFMNLYETLGRMPYYVDVGPEQGMIINYDTSVLAGVNAFLHRFVTKLFP